MTYGSDPDRRLIGITVALLFVVVGVMFWAGHAGGDTASKGTKSGAPPPPTTGSRQLARGDRAGHIKHRRTISRDTSFDIVCNPKRPHLLSQVARMRFLSGCATATSGE